jgi:hypothetical protein
MADEEPTPPTPSQAPEALADMSVPGWSNSAALPAAPPQPDPKPPPPPGWTNRVPATGATAGIPGTWTPAGALPCPVFTQMNTITASPATAWTTGQYVELGDWTYAHWGGAAWTSGAA